MPPTLLHFKQRWVDDEDDCWINPDHVAAVSVCHQTYSPKREMKGHANVHLDNGFCFTVKGSPKQVAKAIMEAKDKTDDS